MSNMFLNIVSTFKGDGIKKATNELGAFGGKLGGFGAVLGTVGKALAGFAVVAKSIEFGKETITAARDLERNLFGLEAVFGELIPQMRQFTINAEEMGLSQSKAAQAATFIGSVLKQSGFAMHDVAIETQNLVSLATDLSAVYGYDVQEALLGMTALFRGEYDPIEKFGVAMKQSEVNARLAAKQLGPLTDAQRRLEEQTVRLEMLYERSTDAVGAFAAQTGTLYVEQKKLGAAFENLQARLGNALIPAVAEMNTAFRETLDDIAPMLEKAIAFVAEVITGLVNIVKEASDPMSELGSSFYALGARFDSLYNTIFGKEFELSDVFDGLSIAIAFALDLMHDVLLWAENAIDSFKIMGHQLSLLFSGTTEGMRELMTTDWNKKILDAWAENAAAANYATMTNEQYKSSLEGLISGGGKRIFEDAVAPPPPGGGGPTGLQAWLADAAEDLQITQKRVQLLAAGLGSAVVESILGSSDALTTGTQALALIVKKGQAGINQLTQAYLGSAAAQAEAAKQAAEAAKQAEQAAEEANKIAEATKRAEEEVLEKRRAAYESFADSVKSIFGQIKDSILSSFNLPTLGNSVNSITRNIAKLLEKTRGFANSISQLSGMGLNSALLQQVIQAGPLAGSRLASAIVGGGSAFISQLNSAYGEMGGLASGIAGVGTGSAFAGQQTINNYSIEVTGGVATGSDVGRAVVNAIKDYERQSGAAWRA